MSQLRRFVSEQVQPYLMDVDTLEANIPCARPLTDSDRTNLRRLLLRPELRDVRPVIEHLLKRGLKLEQEVWRWYRKGAQSLVKARMVIPYMRLNQ